ALGSTVNLTGIDGSLEVSYRLDPWGKIREQAGTTVNRHIFTGQEYDENTGLIYFGARLYEPETARFVTQDAYLGERGTPPSLHRYVYAYSNPTANYDPDGNMVIAENDLYRFINISEPREKNRQYWTSLKNHRLVKAVAEIKGVSKEQLAAQEDFSDPFYQKKGTVVNDIKSGINAIGITLNNAKSQALLIVEKDSGENIAKAEAFKFLGSDFYAAYKAEENGWLRVLFDTDFAGLQAGDALLLSNYMHFADLQSKAKNNESLSVADYMMNKAALLAPGLRIGHFFGRPLAEDVLTVTDSGARPAKRFNSGLNLSAELAFSVCPLMLSRLRLLGKQNYLVTVYRGMGQTEFRALCNGEPLKSLAQLQNVATKKSLFQTYVRHSFNSSKPPSPYVSFTGSPGIARHFIIEGMPEGFKGAIWDFMIRTGLKRPTIAQGKVIAKIKIKRSDLSRTFHFSQDELVAAGGTKIHSIEALVNPSVQSYLSPRIFFGSTFTVGIGVGVGNTVIEIIE
ncbi:MAG: RHS repeat-associated core domain-containing protein, partial [bacterium]|nr:RHS repeat-associated core domain-containing protein [bacterium]